MYPPMATTITTDTSPKRRPMLPSLSECHRSANGELAQSFTLDSELYLTKNKTVSFGLLFLCRFFGRLLFLKAGTDQRVVQPEVSFVAGMFEDGPLRLCKWKFA